MAADIVAQGFTDAQIRRLRAPLNKAEVKRNPKGFDYIESFHAINEANDIFGFDRWSQRVVSLTCVGEDTKKDGKFVVSYVCVAEVTVRFPDGSSVTRADSGFGDQTIGTGMGAAHEGAAKEAVSDAVKRCLRTFGNPFGLALYEKPDAQGNRSEVMTDAKWYADLNLTADQRARVKKARGDVAVEVVIAAMRKSGGYDDAEDFTQGVEQVYGSGNANPTNSLLGDDAPAARQTTQTGAYAK